MIEESSRDDQPDCDIAPNCACKLVTLHVTLYLAPQISSSGAGTAVILFLGFSKLLSPPTVVEKKHPDNQIKPSSTKNI